MIQRDQQFSKRVEEVVTQLETRTDAEVVVVAASRSGNYRDVAVATGSVAALLGFVVLALLPWPVHAIFAVLDLVVLWLAVTWVVEGSRWCVRWATAERQDKQVRIAAAAEFQFEAVHATPRRTGLLVYLSASEGRVELIPDIGLEARVARGRWVEAATRFEQQDLDGFIAGLQAVGELLADAVPALDEDDIDLPNAPRIR